MASKRRHPLAITSDRLADLVDNYGGILPTEMLDWIGRIRHELERIIEADENRKVSRWGP